jgi:hypothetical protein
MTGDLSPERRRALIRFHDALVDLSDDPSPDNVERYLAASRALDDSRARGGAKKPGRRDNRPPLAA